MHLFELYSKFHQQQNYCRREQAQIKEEEEAKSRNMIVLAANDGVKSIGALRR
jgi:hypothetical protein